MANNVLVSPDFLTLTLGIVVYFVGVILNRRIPFLRNYNIPEPVTGGFLAAAAIWVFHALTGLQIVFEMTTRDRLLVIFLPLSVSMLVCPICASAAGRCSCSPC